jgi:hypothetical protein
LILIEAASYVTDVYGRRATICSRAIRRPNGNDSAPLDGSSLNQPAGTSLCDPR